MPDLKNDDLLSDEEVAELLVEAMGPPPIPMSRVLTVVDFVCASMQENGFSAAEIARVRQETLMAAAMILGASAYLN